MSEQVIIDRVSDTWVNNTDARTRRTNYNKAPWCRVKSGDMWTLIRYEVGDVEAAEVTGTVIRARVGPGWEAQTLQLAPIAEAFTPGTVTWNDRPTGGAMVAFVTTAKPNGGWVDFDVSGIDAPHGWRITTNSTANAQYFIAGQFEVTVTYTPEADEPTDLRPDGGMVDPAAPLSWDYDGQTEYRIDYFADDESDVPTWTSGWVASLEPIADRAALGAPAGETWWEVTCRDDEGNTSEPSARAHFTESPSPLLVLTSPTGPMADVTPTILASLTGETMTGWQVIVTGAKRSDVRWDTGKRAGSAVDIDVPHKNRAGKRVLEFDRAGWICVRGWGTAGRVPAVGFDTYAEQWIAVEWAAASEEVTKPYDLSVVSADDSGVRQQWRWLRTEAADEWNLLIDGQPFRRVSADEVTMVDGYYTFTDGGEIPPMRPALLSVVAIEDGKRSNGSEGVWMQRTVEGTWLLPEDPDIGDIMLDGDDVEGFTRSDRIAVYDVLDGSDVAVEYGRRGLTGTFEGAVTVNHPDPWGTLDAVEALAQPGASPFVRLVWGTRSMRVRVWDVHAIPASKLLDVNLHHLVRFGFVRSE